MINQALRLIIIDDNPDIHRDFIKILTISNHASKLLELDKELFGKNGENGESEPEPILPKFEIETASQGEEGVEKIKVALDAGVPFSLAFVDIRMPPGIDGIETIKKIWEFDQEIQVVICTAYSDYSWEDTVKALGMSPNLLVLKKPFDVMAVRQLASALTKKWLLEKATREHTQSLNQLIDRRSESLKQSLALLRVTIESSFDGILVLDLNEKIIDCNKQFVKFLSIPESLLTSKTEQKLLTHMLTKMESSEEFMKRVVLHRTKIDESSRMMITLKDAKVFECFSKPHRVGKKIIGRVWSFHEVTEQIQLKEKLEYQATHDVLTDLPNRCLLLDRIEQQILFAKRSKMKFGVFFLDLDRFKLVNDTLSHEVGDQLLCAIAKRLETVVRQSDTIARLGGDEFVLVFAALKNTEQMISLGNKILEVFKKPFSINKREIQVGVSIGISVYPSDGEGVNQLLSCADLAMYHSKSQGGNQFAFFTEELNLKSEYQFKLEAELQLALKNEEFFLVYQPQFNIVDQHMISIEALLRWQHPEKGIILPRNFIPVTESSGLIIPIGEWVVKEACRQVMQWHQKGLPLIKVAVNVASKQLRQATFASKIEGILKSFGLHPSYLEIEITENVIIDKEIQESILQLKKLGCPIVLDDFGTGNSSLNVLKELHVDRLKIDQSFVLNMQNSLGDEAIVEAIIAISHSMDFKVIAEGVETENQMNFLKKKQCDEIQGFLWGKPLTSQQMEALISKKRSGGGE